MPIKDTQDRYPLLRSRTFVGFWAADSVSMFGTYITAQALQLLAVETLDAAPLELGILRAAQWLPYLLLGLLAGVLIDRHRRKPILVGADLIRAAVLALIPLAALVHALTMPLLIGLVLVFGAVSLLYDAAHQSFLPSLVPARLLTQANVRLEQSSAVAQVAGQGIAGWLIKFLGPPTAILIDAVSYLISGVVLAKLPVVERKPTREARTVRAEIGEGLRWVYGHRTLGPLALSSHAWFFFTSMVSALYAYYVVKDLGFDAAAHGMTLTVGGLGAVIGSSLATKLGTRFEVGPAVIAANWLSPAGYALIPLAHNGTSAFAILCAGQFLFWLSVGSTSPLEMGYCQSVTPDHLLGRRSAITRSLNRGAIVLGAPLGGLLAATFSVRTALWIGVAGLTVSVAALTVSPFRHARLPIAHAEAV
ncbi:MFS transporter [Nocardia sp. NPDC049149]|uniref:MFS transporter n=1 Tax=Nocardia sp. NPDC049149 TaxID=3364315 RepID=UPI0037215AA3